MCGSKMSIDAIEPASPSKHPSSRHQPSSPSSLNRSTQTNSSTSTTHLPKNTTSSSSSSRRSLASVRSSLPENPHLYDISEIRTATNNFLAKNYTNPSSSTSTRCWRCTLLGKDVIIFQRKSNTQLNPFTVRRKLTSICKSHHVAIVNLLGASLSGEYIYFVYDFIQGASLYDLLHNTKNHDYTLLNSWMMRMQIATDIANGLDYIHNNSGLDVTFVHNHISSSSLIVTEPSFNAKICHFGVSELCGEITEERDDLGKYGKIEEIDDCGDSSIMSTSPRKLTRSNSVRFNGTRGYMSPEFQMTGVGTRKSDVYAFGVVLIELLSGEESVKYKLDKATKEYIKISAVHAAKAVVRDSGREMEGRLRKWVDRRLKDSFPVDIAEKLTRLAVECVHVEAKDRPDMRRVAGKISKLYLESQAWCERMSVPTDFTVSFAPR